MKKILSRYKFFIGLCTLFTIIGLIGTSSDLVSAEEVKLVDVTITDFRIENLKHEKPDSINYAESFYLAMDWDASKAGVDIHKGDYFDVTLPSNMWFPSDTSARNFELKNQEGVVIGQATVNPGLKDIGGSIHVIFTDAVENKYNVKGTMYLASKVDKEQMQIGQNNSFSITVNGQVITTEIKITGPTLVGDEILAKFSSGNITQPEKADWSARINTSGKNLHQVVISDTLGNPEMTFLKDSFILQRGKYNEYGRFSQVLETIRGETLIKEGKLKINEDGNSFTLTLGDITDGYYLVYSSTYIPGTKLTNTITLTSTDESKECWSNYVGAESGGTGSGDLASKIKITKVDADDNVTPLANAVFEVTTPDGNTFNLTTGADGTVTSGVLKQGTYTVKEVTAPTGYELNEDTFTLEVTPTGGALQTVKDTPIKRSIKVDKKWIGKEGGPVEVILKADGTEVQRASLDVAGNWTHTFDNLREYNANGQKINYTVEEVSLPNYDSAVSGDMDKGFVITNTEKVSISGTKTWNDNNNQDGVRPDKITINLLANDNKVDSKEVTANDNWAYSFDNLAKYDDKGKEITYTVTENPVDDYTSEQKGNDFTNTHTPATTEISGTKTWKDNNNQDGIRPDKITIHLMANGQEVHTTEATVANNWSYSFSDLPKFENGQEINYTVIEDQVPGYTGEQNGNDFTNTHTPATIQVSGIKTWNDNNDQDGIRPEKITVNLLANGKKVDSKEVTANDNWSYSFSDLPKFENGQEIKYTVNEDAVKDYTTEIIGNNITNSYTPGKTAVNVTKVWLDNNNQDGIRPSEIKVQLYANGKAIKDKVTTLSAANNWQANFTDLDIKADGKVIDYTVKEVTVPKGYKDKVTADKSNNVTITNSYTPATTQVSGTKTWKDNNNQDGIRPDSITVELLANGESTGNTQTVSVDTNWEYIFKDVPKYANGQEVIYTVREVSIPEGYTSEANGMDITNMHTPETTEVSGTKMWNDNENSVGLRPDSITVNLLANGIKVASQEVTAQSDWNYTFTDLPKYANGNEITYTVTEDTVANYTPTYNGYNITNDYTPGETSVTVTKVWDDNNDQDGIRPDAIQVQLYANGAKLGDVITLTAADNWTYTWTKLDENLTYTVKEVSDIEGYTATVGEVENGNVTITNTHTPTTPGQSDNKSDKKQDKNIIAALLPSTGDSDGFVLSIIGITIIVVIIAVFVYSKVKKHN